MTGETEYHPGSQRAAGIFAGRLFFFSAEKPGREGADAAALDRAEEENGKRLKKGRNCIMMGRSSETITHDEKGDLSCAGSSEYCWRCVCWPG